MGLFDRRPLCFFAFLFVAFSLLTFALWMEAACVLFWALALLFLLFLGVSFFCKKNKKRFLFFLTGTIALAMALLAVASSLLHIFLPQRRAERFEGEHVFLAEIVREEYRADDYVRYSVNLIQVDDEPTLIPATLTCYSSAKLPPKDRISAKGELIAPETKDRNGLLLSVALSEDSVIYRQRSSERLSFWELLTSRSGLQILSERTQAALRERMISSLGDASGGLAAAFFVGDRSALSLSVVRDFSRSGTSHLMAVSGLHFSVLLGALDLLLRKLFCPKKGRLVIVSLAGLSFLYLTGFSMSACRSALMLSAMYVTFLFQEDADSITSLFCSLALIVLISPYAIADLGLWMSFLATLGLLTLYPWIAERIPKPKKRHLWGRLLRFLREILMLLLMTTVATLFLLPILWVFFGEISAVSLLANPVLSPISYVFLLGIPIWLVFSAVPFLGTVLGIALSLIGELILCLISFFASIPSATLSLNYRFCFVLIPMFAASMIAVLVIRLRKKWIVLLPPLALLLSFCLCLAAVRVGDRVPCVTYLSTEGRHEALWISDGDEAAICDLSGGAPWIYRDLLEEMSESTASEISAVLLTHYHRGHLASLGMTLESERVRTLYLPLPRNEEERATAAKLWQIAHGAGSEVIFYEDGELPLTEHISARISFGENDPFSMVLTLSGDRESLTYLSAAWLAESDEDDIPQALGESQTLLLGAHGPSTDCLRRVSSRGEIERVIYGAEAPKVRLYVKEAEHYATTPPLRCEIALP